MFLPEIGLQLLATALSGSESVVVFVSQFGRLTRVGSRCEVDVSGRGWTAPTSRGELREHRSALQPVPRSRRRAAESDCCTQRKVGTVTDGEYLLSFDNFHCKLVSCKKFQ